MHAPVAALASAIALCVFLRSTAVHISDGTVDHWPWVPWWACVLIVLAATAAPVVALVRGSSPVAVQRVVVSALAGAVLVVMVTSTLPGPMGQLQGFDDMQSVTGADLLSRGYFPWRDITFIHGPYEDAFRSWPGFALFGRTMWATYAVTYALWTPLTWAWLYLLGAWAAGGRVLASMVVLAGVVYASTQIGA